MDKPTALIIIGGSGAGKSTRVEHYRDTAGFCHLSLDQIKQPILDDLMARGRPRTTAQSEALDDAALELAISGFDQELVQALSRGDRFIVVDYVPGHPAGWADRVIASSWRTGYEVHIEGLWLDPAIALRRHLKSAAEKITSGKQLNTVLRDFKASFWEGFLYTHKDMPRVFTALANNPDVAMTTLLDNSVLGGAAKIVASWHNGVAAGDFSDAAKAEFEKLATLQPRLADFSASITQRRGPQGKTVQSLNITVSNLFPKQAGSGRSGRNKVRNFGR